MQAIAGEQQEGYPTTRLRRQYQDFVGAKRNEIKEQRIARHYYHGDQWEENEVKVLKARRQPILTNNRISRKIDGVVGLLERTRQDPKAYPRTPQQEQGADIATEAMRYTMDSCDWPMVSSECGRNAAVNGIGVLEMALEQGDHADPEVVLTTVEPDTFFYDPRSTRPDFSDARYMGVAKWMDVEEAQLTFPDMAEEIAGLVSTGSDVETWQQQDRERHWIDVDEKRIRVIEHWYRKANEWFFCFYSGTTELQSGSSPFYDEKGRTICRFIAFSSYVDHDGDRYGFVRNLKSSQDEVNARRSKALHQLNTRRVMARKGAVDDVEKARKEWARPDGWVELLDFEGVKPDDNARQADLAGQLQLLEEAKAEVENFGPNPALLGQGVDGQSGRAISMLMQAGMAELGPFLLHYKSWKIRVYRAVWCAIQRYWTSERWIRVTDDEGVAQFMQVNGLQLDPYGLPTLVNALGSLDVDIIMDEGPDTMNVMQDTFDVMSSLAQNNVPIPPAVLIKLSSLPGKTKKEVLQALEQPKQDPEKAALEMENAKAEVGKTKAEALDKFASASQKFAQAFAPQPLPGEYGGDGSAPQAPAPGPGMAPQGGPPGDMMDAAAMPPMPPQPQPAAPTPF